MPPLGRPAVGRRIGADLELSSLKDMLKGLRRELGVPPKRVRYGVRTQDLAKAMATAYAPLAADVSDDVERLNRLNKKAALSTAFCGLLRAAEMSLQPNETWHPEIHLSRADVKFYNNENGDLYAVLMMRPCKNGKFLRGKSVPIVLSGGGHFGLIQLVLRILKLDEAGRPPGREFQSPGVGSRPRGRRARPAECQRVTPSMLPLACMHVDLGEIAD
jgi:hypothetical protein